MRALLCRYPLFFCVLAALAGPLRAQEAGFRKPPRDVTMVVDGFLWIDAEDFADYGGWTLDTQFVHLIGSGYLIANGVGVPVADATTTLNIPRSDRYHVLVRARNWVQEYSPGTFRMCVNSQVLAHTFGAAASDEWVWEDGGAVDLVAGPCELALRDLTGFYGRCDAIILTTNALYQPPADREGAVNERARLTGLSLDPVEGGTYDVIVVGGGSGGCPAALAAARMGARTALIQNRPVLGGNCSSEAGVGLNGASTHHDNARETGIAEETGRTKAFNSYSYYGQAFQHLAERQENLTLLLNQHVFTATMSDSNRIAGVTAVDTLTGQIHEYEATLFIDCTGDGWIGYFAGAELRLGREAREEHDEDLAPEAADSLTMSGCIMGKAVGLRAEDRGAPVTYVAPPWAYEIPPAGEPFGRTVKTVAGGAWWLEHPNVIDDVWGAENARDELIRITFGYWDYVKHESELSDEAANYALSRVPLYDAKRESRRLIGDYILTQNDTQSARVFPDRISYGGWSIDVHHPEGILSGGEGPFWCNPPVPIYTIPYRCLYSKNIDNLLFAGRCCSVTHIALGTVRVQSTLSTLGQAAGTAAALCLEHDTSPRGIYENHVQELQQTLLKNDQTIPGIKNEDPKDLARGAVVTASSTTAHFEFGLDEVRLSIIHPLNMDRCVILGTADQERIDRVHLYLESTNTNPTPIVLTFSPDPPTPKVPGTTMATSAVPASSAGWVEFAVNCQTNSSNLWLRLPKTEGVSWRLMESAPEGCFRAYAQGSGWREIQGQYYAFYTDPVIRTLTDFDPTNVINGVSRIWDGKSNMWASDRQQSLPQWIELTLPELAQIDTVQLTFDTNMDTKMHPSSRPAECVRDYELACNREGRWVTLFREEGNYLRHRVHRFREVSTDKVRLTVTATNGDPSARVFEMRLYGPQGSLLLVR